MNQKGKGLGILQPGLTHGRLPDVRQHVTGRVIVGTDEIHVLTLVGRIGFTDYPGIITLIKSHAPTIGDFIVGTPVLLELMQAHIDAGGKTTRNSK